MKLLRISNNNGEFSTDGSEYKEIEHITKEDIFKIMQKVMSSDEIEFDIMNQDNKINSPAQKIIYENIFKKINELKESREDIIEECERKYKTAFDKYKTMD